MPRPVLLIIVFGIFLAIVGVTAMAQAIMVSAQFSTSTINNVVGSDTALVRLFVTGALSPDDLGPGGPDPERLIALEERLRTLLGPGKIIHVEVRLPDGRVIASDQPGIAGRRRADLARLRDRARRSNGHGRDRSDRRQRGHGSRARADLGAA